MGGGLPKKQLQQSQLNQTMSGRLSSDRNRKQTMTIQQKSQRRLRKSYLDAREKIHSLLSGTEFNPGDQIPAERELTELIGVSRATLRKLITELIDQGVLERQGNQGT